MKIFFKVWSGYTKFLRSQLIEKGRIVVCPILGTFIPATLIQELQNKHQSSPEESYLMIKDEYKVATAEGVCYIPSTEFIESMKLSYQED